VEDLVISPEEPSASENDRSGLTSTEVETESSENESITTPSETSENPGDSAELDTSERERMLDALQERLDQVTNMVEDLPLSQIKEQLEQIQSDLNLLKPGGTGEVENKTEDEDTEEDAAEPTEEMTKTPEAIAGNARIAYYEAIDEYAKAKIAAEYLTAGPEKKAAFEAAGEMLKSTREAWLNAQAELVRNADRIGEDLQLINDQERVEAQGILDALLKNKEDSGDDYDGSLEAEIAVQQANLARIANYDSLIAEHIASREARLQEFAVNELTELSKKVDDEMLAERTRRHPRLTKINNWLQKHPKTRIGVGLGLTAMGVVGTATFNAPLVALAVSGRGALSGYGSYNASRGIGEMIASRKMNKTELATIDDYLGASDRQSSTRRNSKRIGAAVAVAMAAAPAILAMTEVHHAASVFQHKTPGVTTAVQSRVVVPMITPQGGNEYPWTFGMNNLGTNISAQDTLNKIVNNPYGIKFVGNGMGGGNGAIESVFIPGQGTFRDFAHINGAIAAILGK
jgi:hypothetical protein